MTGPALALAVTFEIALPDWPEEHAATRWSSDSVTRTEGSRAVMIHWPPSASPIFDLDRVAESMDGRLTTGKTTE